MGVPLRRVARQAGMSHGHLSKVERGEHGRPITPAILAAYEKVTGVSLADAAAALAEQREGVVGRHGRSWRPGQLTDMRRLAFNAAIGAIAIGGQLGEPVSRLLDSTSRPDTPRALTAADVSQLERVSEFLTVLDLQFGGGMSSQLAKTVLRWAVGMLDAVSVADQTGRRLYGAISAVTGRTAWASFDNGAHEGARTLYRLALYTAVRSGDVNLRAHLLADAAAQHNYLGYHEDALAVIRLAEGDERVEAPVRMVLHGVRARAYAGAGAADSCRRHIGLAEDAFGNADSGGAGWLGSLCQPANLYAITGHAMAVVAQQTGSEADVTQAQQRLTRAVETFDPQTHARAAALCSTRLATIHIDAGDLKPGERWARQALTGLAGVRSARLIRALSKVRRSAAAADDPAMRELVTDIDAALATVEPAA
jgi:transcriptional regulator with XRE-family HTH domain